MSAPRLSGRQTTPMLDDKSWNILTSMEKLTALTMGDELANIARTRPDVVAVTADLASNNGLDVFREAFPDRFIDTGIAEQNMMSVAAGLASAGFIPYVATFAAFASLLCAEQLRTDVAYTKMKVRVLSHHAGIATGFYGTSHHAVEDIAVTRAIGNLTVTAAADGNAIRGLIRATLDIDGPAYIRIGRGAEKTVYPEVPTFEYGRFVRHREGSDLTVIGCGIMVKSALDAADILAAEGISIRVLDAVYLKPLDEAAILAAARETGGILTAEEHNPNGGLGSAVGELLALNGVPTRFAKLALPDDYVLVAPPTHLYRHYGLSGDGVAKAVRALLDRKGS